MANDTPEKTTSPQPSRDPVYQPGRTDGGNTPSSVPPRPTPSSGSTPPAPAGGSAFVGYPQTKYHPKFGARTVNDPNEAHGLPGPAYNWFDTPGEADMHRTDLEAQEVIHHARGIKNEQHVAQLEGDKDAEAPDVTQPTGLVRLSVQAEERIAAGLVEPH